MKSNPGAIGRFEGLWRSPLLVGIVLLLVHLVVYGGNLNDPFVSDDWHFLHRLPGVDPRAMFSVDAQYQIYRVFYRPLTCLLFSLDLRWFGPVPFFMHLEQLALHVGASFVMWAVLLRLGIDARLAAIGSLIFAVHPASVQPVVWIADTADGLLLLFGLLCMWQWLRWLERPTWLDAAATALWMACALASKEPAVMLPVVLLIFCRYANRWPSLGMGAVVVAPWLLYLALRFEYTFLVDPNDPAVRDYFAPSHIEPIGVASRFFEHLKTLFVAPDGMLGWIWVAVGIILLAQAWWASPSRRRSLSLFALWTVVTIIPTLGYFDTRYAAWPEVAFIALLATAVGAWWGKARETVLAVGLTLVVCLALRTAAETRLWQDASHEFLAIAESARPLPVRGSLLGVPYKITSTLAGTWSIQAYEFSDPEYLLWISGHGARVYYEAPRGVTLSVHGSTFSLSAGQLRNAWSSILAPLNPGFQFDLPRSQVTLDRPPYGRSGVLDPKEANRLYLWDGNRLALVGDAGAR